MRKLPEEKIKIIRELREQRLSTPQIAIKQNVRKTTVWRHTRDIIIPRSKLKSEEIIRRYIGTDYSNLKHELTENEKIYLAGLFDGEGNPSIRKDKKGHFNSEVQVTNVNGQILMLFNDLAEGRLIREERAQKNWKPIFRFKVSTYPLIVKFLEQLLPYLRIKRRRAELMLEYCKSRLSHENKRSPYTETELKIIEELRFLNKRGRKNE